MNDELSQAAFDGDAKTVERLLDAGWDIHGDGECWSPLHLAIENENVDCIRLLICRGADIEDCRQSNLTPLAHAVDIAIDGTRQTGGHPGEEPVEIINLLLFAGADPRPGLKVAVDYEATKLVDLLTRAVSSRGM